MRNQNQNLKERRHSSENIGPNDRSKRSNVKENIMNKLLSFIKKHWYPAVYIGIVVASIIGLLVVVSYHTGDNGRGLQSAGGMTVFVVVGAGGDRIAVDVPAAATVADLIGAARLVPGSILRLGGRALEPKESLADAGVGAETVVHAVTKQEVARDAL